MRARYDRDVTNLVSDMRTYDSIYLGPTGNRQVTISIFDIETGKIKKPRTIVYFPVPDRVITAVNKWGRK